jgi:hypothetical protein
MTAGLFLIYYDDACFESDSYSPFYLHFVASFGILPRKLLCCGRSLEKGVLKVSCLSSKFWIVRATVLIHVLLLFTRK